MSDRNTLLLANSPELNMRMRSILVAWMLETSLSFKFCFGTFMAAVDYLDRFSLTETIGRARFQLAGATALWVASKMNEVYFPDVSDVSYVCDAAYTTEDILSMERHMVRSLSFSLLTRLVGGSNRTHELATALYVIHTSSLELDERRARRTIRGLRCVLSAGRLTACDTRRNRREKTTKTIVDWMKETNLNLGKLCVRFGVQFDGLVEP